MTGSQNKKRVVAATSLLVATITTLLSSAALADQDTLYGTYLSSTSRLRIYNPDTGASTNVSGVRLPIGALAVRPADGAIFGYNGGLRRLVQIDECTANQTFINVSPGVGGSGYSAMAFSADGRLFAYEYFGSRAIELIDLDTGVATPVVAAPSLFGGDLGPDGMIYWMTTRGNPGTVYAFDPDSYDFTEVCSFDDGAPSAIGGMTFAPNGRLIYTHINDGFYTLDLATGVAARLSSTFLAPQGLDYGPLCGAECDPDLDGDGLTDDDEVNIYGTDPEDPDTDDDGVLDGTEVNDSCTDPLNPDTDGDNLLDGAEIAAGTNPCDPDTDGDGIDDDVDDQPTVPGVSQGYLEEQLRLCGEMISAISLDEFTGPNNNANKGRRNSLANRCQNAAKSLVRDDVDDAIDKMASLFAKIDGDPAEPDWMHDGAVRTELAEEIGLLITLLILQ